MNIDIEKLKSLTKKADDIFLTPAGEDVLEQLLDIQDQVDRAVEDAKAKVEAAGLKLDPNFSSIQGDKIKITYRAYGPRYYVDEKMVDQLDPELYKISKRYSVNTKAVDEWTETHKGMPAGIKEVERSKKIHIGRKK
jgi:hypothetical protein